MKNTNCSREIRANFMHGFNKHVLQDFKVDQVIAFIKFNYKWIFKTKMEIIEFLLEFVWYHKHKFLLLSFFDSRRKHYIKYFLARNQIINHKDLFEFIPLTTQWRQTLHFPMKELLTLQVAKAPIKLFHIWVLSSPLRKMECSKCIHKNGCRLNSFPFYVSNCWT